MEQISAQAAAVRKLAQINCRRFARARQFLVQTAASTRLHAALPGRLEVRCKEWEGLPQIYSSEDNSGGCEAGQKQTLFVVCRDQNCLAITSFTEGESTYVSPLCQMGTSLRKAIHGIKSVAKRYFLLKPFRLVASSLGLAYVAGVGIICWLTVPPLPLQNRMPRLFAPSLPWRYKRRADDPCFQSSRRCTWRFRVAASRPQRPSQVDNVLVKCAARRESCW